MTSRHPEPAEGPGQDSGHEAGHEAGHEPRGGFDWEAYVAWLVRSHGTLSDVADALAAERRHSESLESIERGLRRLRRRTHGDGGVWGRRAVAAFGLPRTVEDRVRWMGVYHSRFTDLPVPVGLDLLRVWDRAPVRGTPAAAFLDLGLAGIALRMRQPERAAEHLARVSARAPVDAQIEHALTESFRVSRRDPGQSGALLDRAGALLDEAGDALHPSNRACLQARLADQRAWRLNRGVPGPVDRNAALALYEAIPEGGPPFARCRRHNGLGWTLHKLGRTDEGLAHARAAVQEAGDAGMLRLRAMALRLLSVVATGDEAEAAQTRSEAIARRLEDQLLLHRFSRR